MRLPFLGTWVDMEHQLFANLNSFAAMVLACMNAKRSTRRDLQMTWGEMSCSQWQAKPIFLPAHESKFSNGSALYIIRSASCARGWAHQFGILQQISRSHAVQLVIIVMTCSQSWTDQAAWPCIAGTTVLHAAARHDAAADAFLSQSVLQRRDRYAELAEC